ncbi:hypothetical protein D3C86_1101890 [compost metagenome]
MLEGRPAEREQRGAAALGVREGAAEIAAARAEFEDRNGQPTVLARLGRQHLLGHLREVEGRLVGGGLLGVARREQVELGQIAALFGRGYQGTAGIELLKHVRYRGVRPRSCGARAHQTPELQVDREPLRVRDQGISGLAYPVVEEPACARTEQPRRGIPGPRLVASHDEPRAHRGQQDLDERARRLVCGLAQQAELERAANAGGLAQEGLGRRREALQAREHEADDVLAERGVIQGLLVPPPCGGCLIETDEPVFGEAAQQLGGEEGIALGPAVEQRGQRAGLDERGAQAIGHELGEGLLVERRERKAGARVDRLQVFEGAPARMGLIAFLLAPSPHQEQGLSLLRLEQAAHQREGRQVPPLQVVEKEHHRMLGPGEDAEERGDGRKEAILLLGGVEGRKRRLFADQVPDLGG